MNLRIERVIEGRSSLCIPTSSPPSARSSDGSSVSARKTPSPRRGRLGYRSGGGDAAVRQSAGRSSYGDMSPAAVQQLMGYNGPVVSP